MRTMLRQWWISRRLSRVVCGLVAGSQTLLKPLTKLDGVLAQTLFFFPSFFPQPL